MAAAHRPSAGTPTPLGEVLAGTRQVALKRSRAAVDRDTWRRAVGRRIADRTDVGALRAGELTVYVASAAWAQELSLLTREIASVLEASGVHIERVRFRVRTELARKPPRERRSPHPRQALPSELEARLAGIDDVELREAIGEAATLALSRLTAEQARRSAPAPKRGDVTEAPQSARDPRAVAARSAPTDRTKPATPEERRGKRGGRSS